VTASLLGSANDNHSIHMAHRLPHTDYLSYTNLPLQNYSNSEIISTADPFADTRSVTEEDVSRGQSPSYLSNRNTVEFKTYLVEGK
jgi:hypothetical protein